MRRWLRGGLINAAVTLAAAAALSSAAFSFQDSQKGQPAKGWSRITLPFRAVSIASDGNVFWVCGADEMLARSADGGITWQVKHVKAGGNVLLAVHVLDDKIVYAAGTNGDTVWSGDGGETWTAWKAGSERVADIVFGDELHGLRKTISGPQMTSDGGKTWSSISAMTTDSAVSPFSDVLGIAAIDSTHFALLLHKPEGENIFLSTMDGGRSWTPLHLNDTYASTLFARDGKYWALGMEIANRQNRGGYGVPLVLSSVDGLDWKHGAKSTKEFEGTCTLQGCILYDGAIVDLYGEAPRYFAVPGDGTLSPKWAMVQGHACTISSVVRCAQATAVEKPPERPEVDRPIALGAGRNLENAPPDCLICVLNAFAFDKDLLGKTQVMGGGPGEAPHEMTIPGLQAVVDVSYTIQSDGSVGEVQIYGAAKAIESHLSADIQGWLFDPPPAGTAADNQDQSRHLRLLVDCTSFPDDDEATCTAMIPPRWTR